MPEKSSAGADELGLIGYGRFGRFAAAHLARDFRLFIADPVYRRTRGYRSATVEEAASKPIVVLAVPIGRLRDLLVRIGHLVRPRALILDVCSVKEQPVAWMKRYLPESVEIIATHPMFGPDSAAEGLRGHQIVLCPVRISTPRSRCVERYLRKQHLQIETMTPEAHDRLAASTLFFTQFIGRGVLGMKLPSTSVATQSSRALSRIALSVGNDTPELFRDMYRYNRFARVIPQKTIRQFEKLHRTLRRSLPD